MAKEITPAFIARINGTSRRLEAVVVIGASRIPLVIDPQKPDHSAVKEAMDTLCDRLIELAKDNLAQQLEGHLTPTTRAALTS